MNKQELIEKIDNLQYSLSWNIPRINKEIVLDLIEQLDEPQKPVVPQFVADVIEGAREQSAELEDAFEYARDAAFGGELGEWFMKLENRNTFARAWLDGYEVEKEKQYTVKMKNLRALFCYLAYIPDEGYWSLMASGGESIIIKHTRKELEEAGFGEVFDSPLFEVEEVEE